MIVDKPSDLRAAVPTGLRLIGLDVGTRTVGLALSDTTWRIASALLTVQRRKFRDDAAAILAAIDEHRVGGVVVGLPVSLDGTEGPRCQSVRQFARNLIAVRDLPVAYWDERMSTAAVERMLVDEVDASRRRRKQIVDKLAAAYILQGALDALARPPA